MRAWPPGGVVRRRPRYQKFLLAVTCDGSDMVLFCGFSKSIKRAVNTREEREERERQRERVVRVLYILRDI